MKKTLLFIMASFLAACGEGKVNLSDMPYTPKIVINGFITPGKAVDDIRIQRNFPVGRDIDLQDQYLREAVVTITDVATAEVIPLANNFIHANNHFYDSTNHIVDFDAEYRLDVTAVIDGDTLTASSTTRTPKAGLRIVPEWSTLGSMQFLERDSANNVKYFRVGFERSPGTQFYAVSMRALEARAATFIYPPDNPFVGNDVDSTDINKNLGRLRTGSLWIQDTPDTAGVSGTDLYWFFLNFYGPYHLTLYAGDLNFRDFIQTYNQVQDIDGNFYEPVFHIDGDGIGVFASYVADTTGFTILRPEE